MDTTTIILILAFIAGILMAFSMGANDVSNAMAAAVGAKAVTVKQAVTIAAVLNCFGAVFLGSHVAATISTGIINANAIQNQQLLMLGMFTVLLSAGLWVLIATFTGLPVSSTHSIVGSIIGLGLVLGGPEAVSWGTLRNIVLCWMLSPFAGALIAYIVFVHIRKFILFKKNIIASAIAWVPFWGAATLIMVALSLCFKTPYGKSLGLNWVHGLAISLIIMLVAFIIAKKYLKPSLESSPLRPSKAVDGAFRRLQVGTACYVAMSQGASDVSNAIGPLAAVYVIAKHQRLLEAVDIPIWMLLLGGLCIAAGIMLLGYKVMATLSTKITKINNSRGFSVDFSAATVVLLASNVGMPISSTHATVGAIVGVGLARGFAAVDFSVLGRILFYWVLTVPVAGASCALIFTILRHIFF